MIRHDNEIDCIRPRLPNNHDDVRPIPMLVSDGHPVEVEAVHGAEANER
jgi:hypothetical protein